MIFRELLQRSQGRVEIIVTLLAVLELLKRRQVVVEQSILFGEIVIRPVQEIVITTNGGQNGHEE